MRPHIVISRENVTNKLAYILSDVSPPTTFSGYLIVVQRMRTVAVSSITVIKRFSDAICMLVLSFIFEDRNTYVCEYVCM